MMYEHFITDTIKDGNFSLQWQFQFVVRSDGLNIKQTFERPTRIGLTSYVPCLKELGGTLYLFMRIFQDYLGLCHVQLPFPPLL